MAKKLKINELPEWLKELEKEVAENWRAPGGTKEEIAFSWGQKTVLNRVIYNMKFTEEEENDD